MKLFWTGTDSLMLLDVSKRKFSKKLVWILFRPIIRFLDRFYVEKHYCDSQHVADNVIKFGVTKKVEVLHDKIKHVTKYPEKKHDGFNVIYYKCQHKDDIEFWNWIYGYDIFLLVKKHMPYINFIELDGSADMSEVYPITDFYLRPNRHDGASRMRQECDVQGIPYYWTVTEPNMEDAINKINEEYNKQQS